VGCGRLGHPERVVERRIRLQNYARSDEETKGNVFVDLKEIADEVHYAEVSEDTREDILGDLFQGGITYGEHAQYFTPAPICDLMAQVTAGDEPGLGRSFCDPCCGSGRMLLAMAKIKPYGRFVGQDADLRCVKITAINLALHNLYGYAIWGNSLSNERKLVYETGFNGKGVIRKLSDEELPGVQAVEASPPPPASLEHTEPQGKTSQGSLFDGME
jgi:type I restriction-modification system DNA methylase subunit